jgi:hypothetical protein
LGGHRGTGQGRVDIGGDGDRRESEMYPARFHLLSRAMVDWRLADPPPAAEPTATGASHTIHCHRGFRGGGGGVRSNFRRANGRRSKPWKRWFQLRKERPNGSQTHIHLEASPGPLGPSLRSGVGTATTNPRTDYVQAGYGAVLHDPSRRATWVYMGMKM